jgi:hypothetical protein
MYELKNLETYLRVNLLVFVLSSYKKRIYRAAVSQRLGTTVLEGISYARHNQPNQPSSFILYVI